MQVRTVQALSVYFTQCSQQLRAPLGDTHAFLSYDGCVRSKAQRSIAVCHTPTAALSTAVYNTLMSLHGIADNELAFGYDLQVVMRIRPPLQHGVPSWSTENCIHAVSGSTVAIAPPESSQGYKNGDRGQTYNFTRVFNEHTAQEEYFQATAAPLVRRLQRSHPSWSVQATGHEACTATALVFSSVKASLSVQWDPHELVASITTHTPETRHICR